MALWVPQVAVAPAHAGCKCLAVQLGLSFAWSSDYPAAEGALKRGLELCPGAAFRSRLLGARANDARIREMEVGYARLVTISTDNMLTTNEYRTGVGAHWTFLSDPGRKVQKDLDIAEYTDPEHDPMIPHLIVLEPGLVVFKIYNGYWFFGRPTLEELRQDLRVVLRKCRPDWDITTPELKSHWEKGEQSRFYPYGKTYGQVFQEQE
jgi:hypothetical protein